MALTQGSWTKTVVNGTTVFECDVTATTAENDAYTLPLLGLDPSRPYTVIANSAAASLDASALPLDIWGGWTTSGLTGDGGTVKWTADKGAQLAAGACDDLKSTGFAVRVVPDSAGTNVASTLAGVRGVVYTTSTPYVAFNLNGGSTLNAATAHFVVTQK